MCTHHSSRMLLPASAPALFLCTLLTLVSMGATADQDDQTTLVFVTPVQHDIREIQAQIARLRRSADVDETQRARRQSIISALDSYFGYNNDNNNNNKRHAMEMIDSIATTMNIGNRRHSKKKELMQGTVEMMMMRPKDGVAGGATEGTKDMAVVLLTDNNSMFDHKSMNEEEKDKMKKMIDHMLSDLMHADMMGSFNKEMMPSIINGHRTDLVHGFDHPMMNNIMKEAKKSPMFTKENLHSDISTEHHDFLSNFATEEGPIIVEDANAAGPSDVNETRIANPPTTLNSFDPQLQFTTLEVALGPAILPLQVPEGYFVPFIPRKAFGVTNGVARPPHGHASYYVHRPPGLVDVPNSPAFGFLFRGHTRSADMVASAAER